ncbi:carboxylesterase/lipase family protein [Micromonospora sp. NBC_01796]|uniref:carboxylesterase/lipase family protein n=1 Tax=Micromonospora sp. NBC_01796 TaxID=2975987 RepID=UPI002DD94C4D|nr:carboxylesterase family protein [Micromonospora sp. NBC_01796]WSA88582.1 carboxylesterase family protein [Micromonospora sp. NBC_01796]
MNRTSAFFRAVLGLAVISTVLTGTGTASAGPPDAGRDPAVVRTDSGSVRGVVADDHRSFLAIPYAAPPTGELRWKSPRPPANWTGVRDATVAGAACAQPAGIPMGRPSTAEDCLFVNVTTPARTTGRRLPVMVWLHGGSLKYGAGDIYGAGSLAVRGDVVVVSVNYRLGMLGFLAHPALEAGASASGNFGIEDQQAALRWVRRNATAFGGDPGNVTLFGESAGSFSTCAHLAAPASAGLFHRAIMQSGPCTAGWSPSTPSSLRPREMARNEGLSVARDLGCADPATAASCLRRTDVAELLDKSDRIEFGPVLGGPVLPVDTARALAAGHFNRVPVIHGGNRDEERLRVWGMEVRGDNCGPGVPSLPGRPNECPLTADQYRDELDELFGADAAKVHRRYPSEAYQSPSVALGAVLTDQIWSRPILDTVKTLARHTPTYAYEFADDRAPFFVGAQEPGFPLGAFHTSELPYLFDVDYAAPLSDAQARLAEQMIGYWTRFAHTGNPNGGGAPYWSEFSGERVQSLAPGAVGPVDFGRAHRYDFWRSLGN